MTRWITFLFGVAAYVFGMGSLVLFMLFVGGWDVLPFKIDAQPRVPIGQAILINLGLVVLFGIQHSVMARPGFKRLWTRIVPGSSERSWYCVATGVVICLLCYFWQPMAGVVWHVDNAALSYMLIGIQLFGWGLVVASSFMINHFELFGLQQVYDGLLNRPEPEPHFTVKYLYRFVRHPLQLGVLIGMWAAPHMSASHMLLSAAFTAYITTGLYFEEQDLASSLGQDYEQYRRQVPMIVPDPRNISIDFQQPQPMINSDSAAS